MIYDRFELHNVAEVEQSPSGLRLYRFPKAVCNAMGGLNNSYNGRFVSKTTTGCEIRFVVEGDRALISLSSIDQDGYVQIYRGDFRYYTGYTYTYPIKKGQITHIELIKSQFAHFDQMDDSLKRKEGSFSPDVWRIMSDINFTMTLVDFEDFGYKVRPPRPDELPSKTLLCYGTSLTYGACASAQSVSYCQILGRLLGVNLLNKALGGACQNEPEVADYLASNDLHYDALLLENATNMGEFYKEYEERTLYLLDRVTAAKPNIPIYMVTAYPHSIIVDPGCARPVRKTDRLVEQIGTDRIIRGLPQKYPQVKVIEGAEMMNDMTCLTCDLIHLSDYGHIMVASNLAKVMDGDWRR